MVNRRLNGGHARWIGGIAALMALVAGGVYQHASAVSRIEALEATTGDVREVLKELTAEMYSQGKTLSRIAERVGVREMETK